MSRRVVQAFVGNIEMARRATNARALANPVERIDNAQGNTLMAKKAIPMATRRAVALRHGAVPGAQVRHPAECHWCGAPGHIYWWSLDCGKPSLWVTFTDLEMDHMEPEHLGGGNGPENIVLACRPCNRRKGHIPLSEWLERIA